MHLLILSIVGSKDKENRVPCSQVYSPIGETSKHKLWVTIWPRKFNNRNVNTESFPVVHKSGHQLGLEDEESSWRSQSWTWNLRAGRERISAEAKLCLIKWRGGRVEHVYRIMGCSNLLATTFPSNKNAFGNQNSIFFFLQHPNNWRHAEPCQNSCILLGCIVYV